MSPKVRPGQIITFYSYKGGTGRSMALANVAWILASNGYCVLTLDWDLEAPGLHRYFHPFLLDKDLTSTDGLIDFVNKFAVEAMTPKKAGDESSSEWYLPHANLNRYATTLDWKFPSDGRLDFIPAGRQGPAYSTRVTSFDWQAFYTRFGGGAFLDAAKRKMIEEYDYVLIDSRTGVSDTSGICTVHMPDILVVCFTLNNQSIDGAAAVARSVDEQRPDTGFQIFPIPMRIENSEKDKLELRWALAKSSFALFPKSMASVEREDYWKDVQVPYVGYYAYEEILATFGDSPDGPRPLLPSFERLATRLTGGKVTRFEVGPEAERLSILTKFEGKTLNKQLRTEVSPSRLHYVSQKLFGRDKELAALDAAWEAARSGKSPRAYVITLVAWGGAGKTSLVAHWMARLAADDWRGAERVFDWSFFSQGSRSGTVSADTFIAAALKFFGDELTAQSGASPWDKGARLAQLVSERPSLLVLDGIEALQHPPGPLFGKLKDPAVEVLLKGLAQRNLGLCIITSRQQVDDLASFHKITSADWELENLSIRAGVELLKSLGVRGTETEFRDLVKEVDGHALTMNLLGRYLAGAHQGDIRRRDRVQFEKADARFAGGETFRTMAVYERWLAEGGKEGTRALAVLRLLGLFDRPATADSLMVLRREPAIPDLTEPLIGLAEDDWNFAISALQESGLISIQTGQSAVRNSQPTVDAHPLIREYFAKQLRENNPDAWRLAHRRLYEYLSDNTKDKPEPTLEDLQPLYQAVAHGCQAGLEREACDMVYYARILRRDEYYSTTRLGAMGSDLGAIAQFFETPWIHVSSALTEADQAWLMSQAAFRLRALGRLTEAVEPMRAGLENLVKQQSWKNAAASAGNLSELELTLGEVDRAVGDAEESVAYADLSGDRFLSGQTGGTHADALHQAGRRAEAEVRFRDAEQIQAERQPDYPLMYALQGFRYCDLLLTEVERAAWQTILQLETRNSELETASASCRSVSKRALQTLQWSKETYSSLLTIALDHLTLGRARLYAVILDFSLSLPGRLLREDPVPVEISLAWKELDDAVLGLRRAGTQDHLPRGLLTRAWRRSLTGTRTGAESAQTDLDEAWEIAERGPMKLFMADIHLYRARLFHGVKPYPWTSPQEDLAEARKLIEQCGYWRRKEELEDAEAAAKNW
jgi:cellulose biosynthesis protein BcsQ